MGPASRIGAEKRDAAWAKVRRVDVEGLLGGDVEADDDDIERLEDACEALVPTMITVDEDADPQQEIQRLVRLAQVLQLGYERARFELDEENAARQQERLRGSSPGASGDGAAIDEEEMERLYDDLRATNEELKEAYATLDSREEEVTELRVELDRLQAEIPDTELGHAIEAAESELYEERKKKERLEKEVQELEEMLQKSRDSIESLQVELTDERARSNDLEGRVRSLDDDVIELRAQLAAEQKKVGNQSKDEREVAEQLNRANREVDRLLRENRQLDADNTETRNKNSELASEIMQMSEKIIILDEEKQNARGNEVELSKQKEALETIQVSMQEDVATLEAQVEEKTALLGEFEEKFSRQYYDWEETRRAMKERIDALTVERDKLAYDLSMVTNRDLESITAGGDDAGGDLQLGIFAGGAKATLGKAGQASGDMRTALLKLAEAEEKVAVLVEAYEDLERSNASEIEAAIERERRQVEQLKLEKEHREKDIKAERRRSKQVEDDLADLQQEMEDAYEQMAKYEREYGLEEAISDIKKLKRDQRDRDERIATLLKRLHRADITIEDLYERNQEIKRIAGLPDDVDADMDFKLRGRVERAQLRAFNAQLEKEVQELEEERRRLRSELRFRAKWQGEHAARLGLSPAQLSLLEEYADAMRFGDEQGAPAESRTVVQLEEQVKALQERLGGSASAATTNRQSLTEAEIFEREMTKSTIMHTPTTLGTGSKTIHQQLSLTATQNRRMADGINALRAQVKRLTTVNNQIRRAVNEALEHATGVQAASGASGGAATGSPPGTVAGGDSASQLLQSLLDILASGDVAVGATPESTTTATPAPGVGDDGATLPIAASSEQQQLLLQTATEVELRQQIVDLAHELARQSTIISEHDVEMQRLARGRRGTIDSEMDDDDENVRFTSAAGNTGDAASGSPFGRAPSDIAALSEEVIRCLEELEYKNALLASVKRDNEAYNVRLEELLDTRNLLYREHLRLRHEWKLEKASMSAQLRRAEGRADEFAAKHSAVVKTLETLESVQGEEALREKLTSSMMRESVLKVKELRLSRALESALSTETALIASKREAEQGMSGILRSMRSRLETTESGRRASEQRAATLANRVQGMVPAEHHKALSDEHRELQQAFYALVTERADAASEYVEHANDTEDAAAVRSENETLRAEVHRLGDAREALEKRVRETEQLMRESGASVSTFTSLQEELMELRVKDTNAGRRAELAERELGREHETTNELRDRVSELEKQAGSRTRQLHAAQEAEREAMRKLGSCVEKSAVDAIETKANELKARIVSISKDLSDARSRAEGAEMRENDAMRARVVRQTELNELRAAVRDLEQGSDLKAVCGRLHEELITSKARVTSARQQVENFQVYADRVNDENVHLRTMLNEREQELFELRGEYAAKEETQRAAIARLEASLIGEHAMDPAQLRRWAASMESLRKQNESLVASAATARERAVELQIELEAVDLRQKHDETVERLMNDTVPEAYQRNVQLCEQVLQSQLQSSRLTRENKSLREKQAFLESQCAAGEESLLSLEEEKLRAASAFENERAEHARTVQTLQQQLKESRGNSASIRTEYLKKINSLNRGSPFAASLSDSTAGASMDDGQHAGLLGIGGSKASALEHIEQVRLLKLENADLNFKLAEASSELFEARRALEVVQKERDGLIERLSDRAKETLGDSDLLAVGGGDVSSTGSLRKVMAMTVERLETKVAEQERTIASFRQQLNKTREDGLAQLKKDHEEIERLSNAVYAKNAKSIAEMRNETSRSSSLPDKENLLVAGENTPNLQALLREREEHISVLQSKLEQATQLASIVEEKNAAELQSKGETTQALERQLLDVRESTSARVVDRERASLRAQLVEKNKKIRDFSKAVEVLEKKLVESMKNNADRVIAQSDHKLTDQTLNKVSSLEAQVGTLQAKLRLARAKKARAAMEGGTGGVAGTGELTDASSIVELDRLRSEVKKLRKEKESVEAELSKERERSRDLRRRGAGKSLFEAEKKATARIAELEKKAAVLEAQNVKFRAMIAGEEGSTVLDLPADDVDMGGPPTTKDREVQTVSPDGSLFSGIPALERWEREKRLDKKVQVLRTQLGDAKKEVVTLKDKLDRTQTSLTNAQKDRLAMQATIKTMKTEIHRLVNTRVVGSPTQLQALNTQVETLQEDCNRQRVEAAEQSATLEQLRSSNTRLRDELSEIRAAREKDADAVRTSQELIDHSVLHKSRERVRELEDEVAKVESKLLAVRIEKEQSTQTISSLKARLMDWFKDDLTGEVPSASSSVKAATTGPGLAQQAADERDLKNLVSSLQKIIEKMRVENDALKKGVGSNVKYMEVVNKNKALKKAMVDQEQAFDAQRRQSGKEYMQQLRAMETTIKALRSQIKREEKEYTTSRGGTPDKAAADARLRQALEEKDLLEARLTDKEKVCNDLTLENQDLRTELGALDPSFFEEVEDLKFERNKLNDRLTRYETILRDWAHDLGRPYPFDP